MQATLIGPVSFVGFNHRNQPRQRIRQAARSATLARCHHVKCFRPFYDLLSFAAQEAAATRPAGYQNWGGGRLGAGEASDPVAAQVLG